MRTPGVPHRVRSPLTNVRGSRPSRQERAIADELLAGRGPQSPALGGYAGVAEVLAAFSGPPLPTEQRGEAAAMAAFRAVMSGDPAPVRAPRRRLVIVGSLTASQLLVAGLAAAVPVGGLAAAAYTGSLPDAAQRFAHRVVGAPAPQANASHPASSAPASRSAHASPSPAASPVAHPSPVGPDATASAAYGLCRAWGKGGLNPTSIAYRNLALAAGGADGIAAFCVNVPHPGQPASSGQPRPTGDGHPTPPGQPTHPVKATHPVPSAHPTRPAHPSHPAHPAVTSHPAPSHAVPSTPRTSGSGKG